MMMTDSPPVKLIAFVSNSAWSVYNFRLDVIRALMAAGHSIVVAAPEDDYVSELEEAGCRFVPIKFNNKTANPVSDYLFYRRLVSLYATLKPDFIFHFVAKPNIYGSLAAAANGIPSVAVITGLGYPFAKRNWLFYVMKSLYKYALRNTREVWFLNNADAKAFVSEKIAGIQKIKVMPGEGINTSWFTPQGQSAKNPVYTFLMSTRLLKSKGIIEYADAARILRKKNYAVNFELIGFFENQHPDSISPSDMKAWETEGLIKYKGFARDVRPYLSSAHCFVFPSFYNEGVPRCLMEAASMELPVITTATPGCRDVVLNNQTGYLCKPHDPFDLADKMEKMINLSETERRQMGRQARAFVISKFEVDKVIEEYFTTIQNDLAD